MFKNPFFYGERGCLWYAIDIGLAIFAVIWLLIGENTLLAWSILGSDALNILVHIISHFVRQLDATRVPHPLCKGYTATALLREAVDRALNAQRLHL